MGRYFIHCIDCNLRKWNTQTTNLQVSVQLLFVEFARDSISQQNIEHLLSQLKSRGKKKSMFLIYHRFEISSILAEAYCLVLEQCLSFESPERLKPIIDTK